MSIISFEISTEKHIQKVLQPTRSTSKNTATFNSQNCKIGSSGVKLKH